MGFRNYLRDVWNIFDLVLYIVLATAVILRFALTNDTDFMCARNVYALNLIMFYLRTLQLSLIHQQLGPIIVMIWRMVCGNTFYVVSLIFIVIYCKNNSTVSNVLLGGLWQHQGCPTGGPQAASSPRPLPIRPATTVQKTLFTDLCFAVISIYCLQSVN